MTVQNRMVAIQKLQEKSEISLREAQLLFQEGFHASAISHAYYSMFYLAQGMLATKDIYRKKHSGVLSAFSKEFVKTGIVSKDLSSKIQRAFEERLVADYGDDFEFAKTEEEAKKILGATKEFLEQVRPYLDDWIRDNNQ